MWNVGWYATLATNARRWLETVQCVPRALALVGGRDLQSVGTDTIRSAFSMIDPTLCVVSTNEKVSPSAHSVCEATPLT